MSSWSESNKKRDKNLIVNGLITQAGLEVIEIAKRNDSGNRLDDIDKELVVPGDLEAALAQNPKDEENFPRFTPSQKKQYLWWLKSAKRAETRERRIREIVKRAEENIKPGI